jgi:hypothetical protein
MILKIVRKLNDVIDCSRLSEEEWNTYSLTYEESQYSYCITFLGSVIWTSEDSIDECDDNGDELSPEEIEYLLYNAIKDKMIESLINVGQIRIN